MENREAQQYLNQQRNTMEENYSGHSSARLSLEDHYQPLPVFDPFNHNLLLAQFNLLNLLEDSTESLQRNRTLSAARGQTRNISGLTHDDNFIVNNQNTFTGQSQPVYGNSMYSDPMYATNGPAQGWTHLAHPQIGWVRTSTRSNMDSVRNIKFMAKDKNCSQILKLEIEGRLEDDLVLIFEELKDDIAGLMVHCYGSTVVQKLFEVCTPDQISYILQSLVPNKVRFAEICCNPYGSLAMKKLLNNLRTCDQIFPVISALSSHVHKLSTDENGHKVVEHCISSFHGNVDMLIYGIAQNSFEIATHKIGCYVMQSILNIAFGKALHHLASQLCSNALLLSENKYGNYVVQYLLEKTKDPSINKCLLDNLAENFVSLSMDKYSSNVVEKCLTYTSECEATKIIDEIIRSENLLMILQDQFGNFVIQTALEVSQKMRGSVRGSGIHFELLKRIRSFEKYLKSHPYGNRVLLKLSNLSSCS